MLCDKCKKNEATVHMTNYSGGKSVTTHLCDSCFREDHQHDALDKFGGNLAEILFNIENFASKVKSGSEPNAQTVHPSCPQCGLTLKKLRSGNGRLGCPECYNTFSDLVKETIANVQNGSIHLGKRPKNSANDGNPAAKQDELRRLQEEIKKLVAAEKYEAAAACRDRIAVLKNEIFHLERGEQ